jgi:hypothetical protein
MQTWPHRARRRRHPLWTAVEDALVSEGRAAWRGRRGPTCGTHRIQHGIDGFKPTFDGFITARRHDEQIAGTRCSHISHSHGFSSITPELEIARFQELNRRCPADLLQPDRTAGIDVSAWAVPGGRAGRISKNHDRKLQALSLEYSHDPNALGTLFHNRRFVDFTALGVGFDALDECAERGSTSLEASSRVYQSLTVGERLLAVLPKSNASLRAHSLQEHSQRFGNRPAVASCVKLSEEIKRVGHLQSRRTESGTIGNAHWIETAKCQIPFIID